MSVVEKLTKVKARLLSIPKRLGVPDFHRVIVQQGSTQTDLGYLPVHQVSIDTTKRYLSSNVEISPDDLQVTDIPRLYPDDLLAVGYFLIDPILDTQTNIWTPVKKYKVVHLDRSDLLAYSAVIRKMASK